VKLRKQRRHHDEELNSKHTPKQQTDDRDTLPIHTSPPLSPARLERKSVSSQEVLQLQQMIGNRAVSTMLAGTRPQPVIQRYELEGPFNKNDPVHEVLTLTAIKEALEKIKSEKKEAGSLLKGVDMGKLPNMDSKDAHNLNPTKIDPSAQQFIRGVIWPDDPKGYLFDDDKSTENYSSGTMWYEEFDPDEKDEPEELIARSHYGDLQFFHAMATKDGEDPKMTKEKIMKWARFLTELANGSIDPNSKVKDVPAAAELFTAHKDITLKKLFGYAKGKDEDIRQRAAGALMHLIQDSNAEGHVGRDKTSGDISQFHSYEGQDHGEHGAKDAWADGKTLGDHIKNTPGAENAVHKCAAILVLLDQGASTDEIIKYLDEQIFKLDPKAEAAGPGAEFKKK
jgi:hypothetical protein